MVNGYFTGNTIPQPMTSVRIENLSAWDCNSVIINSVYQSYVSCKFMLLFS